MLSPWSQRLSGRVVLASASPRRAELLKRCGLSAEQIVSGFPEDLDSTAMTAAQYASANAALKAAAVAEAVGGDFAVIVGADTVVVRDGAILEKPRVSAMRLHITTSPPPRGSR